MGIHPKKLSPATLRHYQQCQSSPLQHSQHTCPRTPRGGESRKTGPPIPLTTLPPLYQDHSQAARPQALFPLANDSTESLEKEISPLDLNSSPKASRRQQRPPPIRTPLANDSIESMEVADFVNSAFHRPLSLYLQPHIRTGMVQTHQPVVVSPVSPEPDTATGNFVSNMVKSMEKGTFSNVSSKGESFDQGELAPSSTLELRLEQNIQCPGAVDQNRCLSSPFASRTLAILRVRLQKAGKPCDSTRPGYIWGDSRVSLNCNTVNI